LTTPSGIAALNQEVTRQAAMISYIDDIMLMLIVILASLPLLLLVRVPRRQPVSAATDDYCEFSSAPGGPTYRAFKKSNEAAIFRLQWPFHLCGHRVPARSVDIIANSSTAKLGAN
jgi:hypothetical protein